MICGNILLLLVLRVFHRGLTEPLAQLECSMENSKLDIAIIFKVAATGLWVPWTEAMCAYHVVSGCPYMYKGGSLNQEAFLICPWNRSCRAFCLI